MKDEYLEEFVIDYINNSDDLDIDEIATSFENDELNYNNADKTSGQKVYEFEQIKEQVTLIINELKKHDDRCPSCCKLLDEEEGYEGNYESRGEFWGSPCSEYVVTKIKCIYCGYEENI